MILLVLMLAPFSFSTGAFVFAGLLGPMAADLGVSVAAAGQLQTAFALSCAVGGPVLAGATARFPRKTLLVSVLCVLAAGNALCALAADFRFLMAVRVAEGFVGALTLPLASAIAVASVAPERRGAALAVVFAGIALAFLVGVPLGSLVGSLHGWPAAFWLASAIAGVAAVLVTLLVPKRGDMMPPAGRAFRTVLHWPLTGLLSLTFIAFGATFTTVAYIGPIITRLTGLTGGGIGAMQVSVGLGGILGLALGARLAGRQGPVLPALFVATIVAQSLYSVGLLVGIGGVAGIVLVAVAATCGSAALFAASPVIQTRLAAGAGGAATLAFALNGSMVFLGQGAGAALGGLVSTGAGVEVVGLVGASVAAAGLLMAVRVTRAVQAAGAPAKA